MLETARSIEAGARPLGELRPDLPKRLLRLVDRALSTSPGSRPPARELAAALRGLTSSTSTAERPPFALPRVDAGAAAAAGLAALFTGWIAAVLPFYPGGWAFGLAALAAALTLYRERAGLALALAVPFFPLGNISLGLALLYAALAAAWLLVTWREPRAGLLFALGPLLAPVAALGLLPLAAIWVRGTARRALVVALGVLTAALAAGIRHAALPLVGGAAPHSLGVEGARGPLDVAGSLAHAAAAHPSLLIEAAALALVAAAIPYAQALGRWGAAGIGAAMILLTVAAVPVAAATPLVLSAWAIATYTALRAPALGVPSPSS
jgi:hypothetical protein